MDRDAFPGIGFSGIKAVPPYRINHRVEVDQAAVCLDRPGAPIEARNARGESPETSR